MHTGHPPSRSPPTAAAADDARHGSDSNDITLVSMRQSYKKHRLKLLALLVVAVALAVVFVVFDNQILDALRPLTQSMRDWGVGGYAIIALGTFLCSFPPIFGYSSVVVFAGYVYGFLGFIPCFIGASLGSAVCYPLFRKIGKKYVVRAQRGDPKIRAVLAAVEKEGFRMILWIRVTPISFCVVNMVLPTIPNLRFGPYILATMLSLPKLLVHIFIGTRVAQIADSRDTNSKTANYVYLAVASVLGVGLLYYIYRVAWHRVEAAADEDSTELSSDMPPPPRRVGDEYYQHNSTAVNAPWTQPTAKAGDDVPPGAR